MSDNDREALCDMADGLKVWNRHWKLTTKLAIYALRKRPVAVACKGKTWVIDADWKLEEIPARGRQSPAVERWAS